MHQLKPFICLLFTVVLGIASAGCASNASDSGSPNASIRAVATIGMITDIAQRIGGEYVTVTGLMGAGIDPHLYRPTASNINALQNAQIILRGGLNLEGQMGEIFDRLSDRIPVITMADDIPEEELLPFPQFPEHHDPHIWFNVDFWSTAAGTIANAFAALDPAHASTYAANARQLQAQLADLDAYVMRAVASIPEGQRVMITAHDAFNYFGQRYGIEVRGLQGISTEAEAGVQDVQSLVSFIVENQIPAIFVETSVPQRTIEAVQEAARAQGWDVQVGGTLFSDAMGDPGTSEGTYAGMILHNVAAITTALGGELPPLPASLSAYEDVVSQTEPS